MPDPVQSDQRQSEGSAGGGPVDAAPVDKRGNKPGWLACAPALLLALLCFGRGGYMLTSQDWSDLSDDQAQDTLIRAILIFATGSIALMPAILLILRGRADHGFWWLCGMSYAMLAITMVIFLT